MDILASHWFHALLWILVSFGLIGNVAVVVRRCTRPRDQRQSTLSMMIIILAVTDFLCCFQTAVADGYVLATFRRGPNITVTLESSRGICISSNCLIVLTSSIAMWVTFNIAIYSRQALTGRNLCYRCCRLADRKYGFCWMLLL